MIRALAFLLALAPSLAWGQSISPGNPVSGTLVSGNIVIGGPGSQQVQDSGLAPVKNFDSTVDPGVNDDVTQGYAVGSTGINTATGRAFTAQSVAVGTAVWVPSVKIYAAASNPGVGNDNTQGYAVGSTGINTATGRQFIAQSVATGAAVWLPIGPTAWSAGSWYLPLGTQSDQTGAAIASTTTISLVPFVLPPGLYTIDQLGIKIQTVGTSNSQIGIYAAGADNLPTGAALAHTGDVVNTATATTSGALVSNVQLKGNTLYWAAVTQNDTAVIYVAPNIVSMWAIQTIGNATLANLSGGIQGNALQGVSATITTYNSWPTLTGASWTLHSSDVKLGMVYLHVLSTP